VLKAGWARSAISYLLAQHLVLPVRIQVLLQALPLPVLLPPVLLRVLPLQALLPPVLLQALLPPVLLVLPLLVLPLLVLLPVS
jgi:hypothetical protein